MAETNIVMLDTSSVHTDELQADLVPIFNFIDWSEEKQKQMSCLADITEPRELWTDDPNQPDSLCVFFVCLCVCVCDGVFSSILML